MRAALVLLSLLSIAPFAAAEDEGLRACVPAACAYDATYSFGDASCESDGVRHASTGAGAGIGVSQPGIGGVGVVAALYATDYCTTKDGATQREHGVGATASVPGAGVMAWWGEGEGSHRFPDGCQMGARVGTLATGGAPVFVPCPEGAAPPDAGWGRVLP